MSYLSSQITEIARASKASRKVSLGVAGCMITGALLFIGVVVVGLFTIIKYFTQ